MNPRNNGLRPVVERVPGPLTRAERIERWCTVAVCLSAILACILWAVFQ